MRCARCGTASPPGQKFCGECGARLLACPACGAPVAPGLRFCGQCGGALGAPAPARAPESYTPAHLAERILTARASVEGERKQVTVLRADVKGSLALLADRDPEDARRLLDPMLERMMEAVHRYEGTVSQVMGDGIMALFGAPLAHEDHAVRACYAAIRMQAAVRRLAEAARREGGAPAAIRIGINSGEVLVRSIGSDLRMDYTAVGHTTHLAGRMEQAALPGSILIAGETFRLVEGYVETRALGPIRVDGVAQPVEAHEVLGPGSARTRVEAAADRGLTRFVGRAPEMERLRSALERSAAGQGHVVAVIGEPGIGKSRLLYEFARSAAAQGWRRLEWEAPAHGRATPYRPVIALLRGYFALEDQHEPREARERVMGRLAALDQALAAAAAPILALLGLPADDPAWDGLDPAGRRHRTLDVVRGLVLRESRVQPLLLVLEDLQWIDAETQAFLDALVESLPVARILLLASYRPEYQHAWASKSAYDQIRLSPLAGDSVKALLDGLLGADPALVPVKAALAERTDGNPFFLEECTRSLAETRVLDGRRGSYRLAGPLPAAPLPATVQAVLAARIDRLPPEEKLLLETAAVIGKDVPLPLLEAVAGLPPEAVRRALVHLTAAELLYERGLFPDPELTFTHTLTHDVAYTGLLADRRRDLHARIVTEMEALYADQLGEHVERLADHAVKGERWDRAAVHLVEAGGRALMRSASREAVALLGEALAVLERLPADTVHRERAVDCHLMLRNAHYVMGEDARALDAVRRAEALAAQLGDRRRLAQVWAYLAQHLRHRGEHAQAIRSGQRALAAAQAPADDTIRVTAGLVLGQAHQTVGDFPRAIEALVTTVPGSLEGALRRIVWIDSRAFLAWSLAEIGAFEDARSVAEEATHAAEQLGHAYSRAVARMGAGALYLAWGRPAEAIAVLEEGVAIIRQSEVGHPLTWAATFLGSAYTLAGRVADALPPLTEAVELAERRGIVAHQSWRLCALAEARAAAGDPAAALETAESALALAQRLKERAVEASILHLLAGLAAARPAERDAAAAQYRHALALADALGMRPLAARCHLGLAALLRAREPSADGQAHLETALEMLRAMDMRHWLDQAAREVAVAGCV